MIRGAAFALLLLLWLSPFAHAHRVYVFAWTEGDTVHTESYLSGKKKVVNGRIQVFDAGGAPVVEGTTDDKGAFSFPLPKTGDLRIVLESGMGHRAEYLLKVSEQGTPGRARVEDPGPPVSQAAPAQVDREEIRKVVEEVLDAKLAPLMRELRRMREPTGPGFREIAAGVGYILGIMGLVLYFRSRKRQGPPQDRR